MKQGEKIFEERQRVLVLEKNRKNCVGGNKQEWRRLGAQGVTRSIPDAEFFKGLVNIGKIYAYRRLND